VSDVSDPGDASAVGDPSGRAVYLVRHAKAGSRSEWEGPDALRPLSKPGRRQARRLARHLREAGIERIVSSPSLRCVQTVEPLAAALGLQIELADGLAEGAGLPEAIEVLRSAIAANTVLCSHGDVIPMVVDHLAADGLRIEGPTGWQKGSIWVLEGDGARFVRARYRPPPEEAPPGGGRPR
jgi:8-oxo-dGTP diphosphatase